MNCLIIDDSEIDSSVLANILKQKFQADIVEMKNGARALSYLSDFCFQKKRNSHPPDLIFLDISMPECNGFCFLDAFEQLREILDFSNTQVLMYSSTSCRYEKEKALRYRSVKGFIRKNPDLAKSVEESLNGLLSFI